MLPRDLAARLAPQEAPPGPEHSGPPSPAPSDTTFVIEDFRPETLEDFRPETMETGRDLASLSMMQSTVEENLACIRGLAGSAAWPGRQPVPALLPDLGLVLADLGLGLEHLEEPQVFTDRS
jgi:hypothetical protein